MTELALRRAKAIFANNHSDCPAMDAIKALQSSSSLTNLKIAMTVFPCAKLLGIALLLPLSCCAGGIE